MKFFLSPCSSIYGITLPTSLSCLCFFFQLEVNCEMRKILTPPYLIDLQ